jgi:hypothetical protein
MLNFERTGGLIARGWSVQIGLSETCILRDYHVDAVERYNVTCDFPGVIRELKDPNKRFPFQVSASHGNVSSHL